MEKHIMAVLVGIFRRPEISGVWQKWDAAGNPDAPDPGTVLPNGRRKIASAYYPSVGVYDNSDPDYVEYMAQLSKMCYIDTLNFHNAPDDTWWSETFQNITLPILRKYSLRAVPRITHPGRHFDLGKDDEDGMRRIFDALTDRMEETAPAGLMVEGRQAVSVLHTDRLSPGIIRAWKEEYMRRTDKPEPFFLCWVSTGVGHTFPPEVDGFFDWAGLSSKAGFYERIDPPAPYRNYVTVETACENYRRDVKRAFEKAKDGIIHYYADTVCPGYDDSGVFGWGKGVSKIERGEKGELYEYKWKSAAHHGCPMVCIPTWDDYAEGSLIEPTLEYGTRYMELTRKYAADYLGIAPNRGDLELPGVIYKIRKTTRDARILSIASTSCELIAAERYAEAKAILSPEAEKLGIPFDSKVLFEPSFL